MGHVEVKTCFGQMHNIVQKVGGRYEDKVSACQWDVLCECMAYPAHAFRHEPAENAALVDNDRQSILEVLKPERCRSGRRASRKVANQLGVEGCPGGAE